MCLELTFFFTNNNKEYSSGTHDFLVGRTDQNVILQVSDKHMYSFFSVPLVMTTVLPYLTTSIIDISIDPVLTSMTMINPTSVTTAYPMTTTMISTSSLPTPPTERTRGIMSQTCMRKKITDMFPISSSIDSSILGDITNMIQSSHMTLLSNSHRHVLSLILSTPTDIYDMKTSIINTTSSAFSTTIKINTSLPYTNNNDKKLIEILIPVLLIVMLYVTYFLYNKLKLITTKKENYEVLIPMTNSFSFKVVHDDDDDEILILQ